MAVTGTYQDHYADMFNGTLSHEFAKKGSILKGLVTVESVSGNKNYFDKLGKKAAYLKTQRAQDRTYTDSDFERRLFTRQTVSYDEVLDIDDMTRFVSDPTSDIMMAAVESLGRRWDEIVFDALTGTANVIIDGSASTTSITNTIAVNDHTYDPSGGTNDICLTDFKLKNAKKTLMANYVDVNREPLFVLAPANQIMHLTSSIGLTSGDYRNNKPLDLPNIVSGLSGYLGFNFIAYEDTGLSGTDELVYIFPKSALKVGTSKPLKTQIVKDTSKVGIPDTIAVTEDIGAVRMFDEAVIKVICDPTTSVSA